MTDHEITPPPELVQDWRNQAPTARDAGLTREWWIATQAARWGADQQKIRSGPESPLVERVADAIAAQATSAGIVNDRPARAAILQVAMWLREQDTPASNWAMRLEQEATPSPRRPKPPSLKEQALAALAAADGADHPVVATVLTADQHAIIRRALEQLDG